MRLLATLLLSLGLLLPAIASRAEGSLTLLTVTGAIDKTNRGPLDPFRDALLAKYLKGFERAYAFDAAALAALPQSEMTLSYDAWDGPHSYRGPTLAAMLEAVGAHGSRVKVVALDGYAASFDLPQVAAAGMILASEMDGAPLGLGGQGPLRLVFAPGSLPGQKGDAGLVYAVTAVVVE